MAKSTVEKIYNHLKELTNRNIDSSPTPLGVSGMICQIDESMFLYKQKYHVGRVDTIIDWFFVCWHIQQTWIFYWACRKSRCWKFIENKSENVLPNTIIWSDMWFSYINIQSLGFDHCPVNHSFHFVNPVTDVITQTVESLRNKLKKRLKWINVNYFLSLKKIWENGCKRIK